jgi:hypothetical protein
MNKPGPFKVGHTSGWILKYWVHHTSNLLEAGYVDAGEEMVAKEKWNLGCGFGVLEVVDTETAVVAWAKGEASGKAASVAEAIKDEWNHRALDLEKLFIVKATNGKWVTNAFVVDAGE